MTAPEQLPADILKLIESFTIEGVDGTPFMTRYKLARTEAGNVYLHHFHRSDEDDAFHDHPFDFTSWVIQGGYIEHVVNLSTGLPFPECEQTTIWRPPGSVIHHRAEDAHRIELPIGIKKDVWTLVFVGPKRRDWGFHTAEGWIRFDAYFDRKFGAGKWQRGKPADPRPEPCPNCGSRERAMNATHCPYCLK